MNNISLYFLKEIKDQVKKSQLKKCIEKVQKFFEKQNNLSVLYADDIIHILFLQLYSSSKIFYAKILQPKQDNDFLIHDLLLIMHRNLKISYELISGYVQNHYIFICEVTTKKKPHFRKKSVSKSINYFFKSYLIFCKILTVYYELRNCQHLKMGILLQCMQVLDKTCNFEGKNMNLVLLGLQIKAIFSSCLKQNQRHFQSLYILKDISSLLKAISDIGRKNYKSKKMKVCIKLLYMSLISMIELHILTNRMGPIYILHSIANKMISVNQIRKILKNIKFLHENVDEIVNQDLQSHEEFSKIIEIGIPQVLVFKQKFELENKGEAFDNEEIKKFEEERKIIKTQIMKLVYGSFNKVLQSNLMQLTKNRSAKRVQIKKSTIKKQRQASIFLHLDQQVQENIRNTISMHTNQNQKSLNISRKKKEGQNNYLSLTEKREKSYEKMKNFQFYKLQSKKGKLSIFFNDVSEEQKYINLDEKVKDIQNIYKCKRQSEKKINSKNKERQEFSNLSPKMKFIKLIISNRDNLSLHSYYNKIIAIQDRKNKSKLKKDKNKKAFEGVKRQTKVSRSSFQSQSDFKCKRKTKPLRFSGLNDENTTFESGIDVQKRKEKMELNFLRSKESIMEITKKIQNKPTHKRIMRKSQTYFENLI